MFTTIVASVIFAVLLIIFLYFAFDELTTNTRDRQISRDLQMVLYGTYKVWDFRKLTIMFMIWFACGWYLWG